MTAPPLFADGNGAHVRDNEAGIGDLGDFRLIAEVGRGGMGVVYEAMQLSLNRRVALKVLPFAAAMDPTQRRRFQTEALAAAQLHHTHIVPVYSVGCERGVHYYAMQFIEGQTLAQVIAERRRLEGPMPARSASPPVVPAGSERLSLEFRLPAESGRAEAGTPTRVGRESRGGARDRSLEFRLQAESGPAEAGTPTAPGHGLNADAETLASVRRGSPDPAGPADRRFPIPAEAPTLRTAIGAAASARTREYCRTAAALGIQAAEASTTRTSSA